MLRQNEHTIKLGSNTIIGLNNVKRTRTHNERNYNRKIRKQETKFVKQSVITRPTICSRQPQILYCEVLSCCFEKIYLSSM